MTRKYIRKAEKNLRHVFDAAEPIVLIFDEADALFGKRCEVKDRHDRYRTGDYWVIPARTDISPLLEWPEDDDVPLPTANICRTERLKDYHANKKKYK